MFRFEALRPQHDDRLAFLKGFLREPKDVGSVIPSSRFLERRMVRMAGVAEADSVIELGPGTGGTTRAILAAMPESATLLAVELDPMFADLIRGIDDRRLIVHQGSAEQLAEAIAQHHLRPPKAILSGIPFSTMPEEVGTRIIEAIRDVLAPGGCFVAYQFRGAVADRAKPILGEPEVSPEFLNIPPMRVYRWRKR
ncbi:MAG: methyltransferase type 12 [Burkholderiales bacterium]|nr:MAG: methyltransferase type 12 [Burkholderiales bacterium]